MTNTSLDATREAQQRFIYDLLGALDRRRSAVDTRCAVVFATAGLAFGLFVNLTKSDSALAPTAAHWSMWLYTAILTTLMLSVLFGLSLIAPISRPRKVRKEDAQKPTLSWFYQIADMELAAYLEFVSKQTPTSLLDETAAQVVRISRLLKTRYDRLQRTCQLLTFGIILFLVYVLLLTIFPEQPHPCN